MLLLDGPLTFQEFMGHEDVPLAAIFREVLVYLSGRDDAVLFGAQAVNAYCEPPRMTADLDLLSTRAAALAEELRAHLAARFHIAARVRQVVAGAGFRVYQSRNPRNRHLVDVRQIDALPSLQRVEGVAVVAPAALLAMKAIGVAARRGQEKELSDRLDVARLLRTFPELRSERGAVDEQLRQLNASALALAAWAELVQQRFEPDEDDGY
jgi:hypothetical protein